MSSFPSSSNYTRTDLACEAGRPETEHKEEILYPLPHREGIHILRCREADGHRYITVSCGRITLLGDRMLSALGRLIGKELRALAAALLGNPPNADTRILVAGLGNPDMTADAIGPFTVRRLTATRHLKCHDAAAYTALGCSELSATAPGVLGQTGIESGELVKGAVAHVRPHLLIAIDALAARSCARLASTIQISDGGISPGAGVGNNRMAMDKETMGCPVIGVGIPTVVNSSTLVYDALAQGGMSEQISSGLKDILENGKSFFVSPKDADEITELSSRLLAGAIDHAFGIGEL
ncbi:MAG: GPR endopeptidase [Clostridia bacterium]|nr:GPR endopeptidase [Clostridia bacterium]